MGARWVWSVHQVSTEQMQSELKLYNQREDKNPELGAAEDGA